MELTKDQKYFLYEQLGDALALMRKESKLQKETVAKYAEISLNELDKLESGCPDFGNMKLYMLMRWAAIFRKKLKITFEDFTDKDKLDAYELVRNKIQDFNRYLC